MQYISHVHTHTQSNYRSVLVVYSGAGSEIKAYLTLTLEWTELEL